MKHIFIIFSIALSSFISFAQSYKAGQVSADLGIGLGLTIPDSRTIQSPYRVSAFTPLLTNLDIGVVDNVSLGVWASYSAVNLSNKTDNWLYDRWFKSYTTLGIQMKGHLGDMIGSTEKFDPYVKLMVGSHFTRWTYITSSSRERFTQDTPDLLAVGAYVGGRYFPTSNIGFFGEIGWGVSFLNLGISFQSKK